MPVIATALQQFSQRRAQPELEAHPPAAECSGNPNGSATPTPSSSGSHDTESSRLGIHPPSATPARIPGVPGAVEVLNHLRRHDSVERARRCSYIQDLETDIGTPSPRQINPVTVGVATHNLEAAIFQRPAECPVSAAQIQDSACTESAEPIQHDRFQVRMCAGTLRATPPVVPRRVRIGHLRNRLIPAQQRHAPGWSIVLSGAVFFQPGR